MPCLNSRKVILAQTSGCHRFDLASSKNDGPELIQQGCNKDEGRPHTTYYLPRRQGLFSGHETAYIHTKEDIRKVEEAIKIQLGIQ